MFELNFTVRVLGQGEKKSSSPFAIGQLWLPTRKASPGKKQVHSVTSFFIIYLLTALSGSHLKLLTCSSQTGQLAGRQ